MQRENLKKGIFLGLFGNVFFLAFGLVCLLFYVTYDYGSLHSRVLEAIAYSVEVAGFLMLVYGDYLLIKSVRLRRLLKVSFSVYIALEAIMMILELNYYRLDFYQPYSLPLAMAHSAICALVCFAFLQLDPDNVKWECVIGFCFTLIIAGMMGNLMGVRVYFSIIFSAVGFTVLFAMMRFMHDRQELAIDCYGDNATEAVYDSSLFTSQSDNKDE